MKLWVFGMSIGNKACISRCKGVVREFDIAYSDVLTPSQYSTIMQ